MNSDSIVIIPTYNERENIAQMIDTVLALPQPFHLLIVDMDRPTAPQPSYERSKQNILGGYISWSARASSGSAQPTSPDSSGLYSTTTSISSRWTVTSATLR